MNENLLKGTFPRRWKRAKLILIEKPKPAGGDKQYRPICLLDTAGKLFEHLIKQRLIKELKLSVNQYGFREKKSTIDAMYVIKDKIIKIKNKAYQNREFCVLVTLDIKNAFNTARWSEILKEMCKMGISEYLVNIASSYLSDRTITLEDQSEMQMTCGVPQGSVLGPVLWNILYNEVLQIQTEQDTQVIGFADDTAVVVTGKSREEVEDKANATIRDIIRLLVKKGLQIAPDKTEAVILYGGRRLREIEITVQDKRIRSKETIRYLGVHFSRNNGMKEHLKRTAAKAERSIQAISALLPNIGGPKASNRRIMCSVVNSVLLYAAPIWREEMAVKSNLDILTRSQRRTAIRICSAYRTISLEAVQVIAGCIPIDLLVEERCRAYHEKIGQAENRKLSIAEWENRWSRQDGRAAWTKTVIRNIRAWTERKHGQVNYYLTQVLGGHGCFGTYLKRFKLRDTDDCMLCGGEDTVQHTIRDCRAFHEIRTETEAKVGVRITAHNMVELMLASAENWEAVSNMVSAMIRRKEEKEREDGW